MIGGSNGFFNICSRSFHVKDEIVDIEVDEDVV
jgi:hypothetical protein